MFWKAGNGFDKTVQMALKILSNYLKAYFIIGQFLKHFDLWGLKRLNHAVCPV